MANPTITLVGRLGQDPAPVGDSGLRLRLVTNDRVKNDVTGNYEDSQTSWWTIKVWGKLAEQARNSIKKGQELTITGKIYEDVWTDKTGTSRSTYEVRADSIAVTTFSLSREKAVDRMLDDEGVPF